MSNYVATAGWVGVVSFQGHGPLRFTSESIVVNQGLEVSNDVHVGQRVSGVLNTGISYLRELWLSRWLPLNMLSPVGRRPLNLFAVTL